MSNLPAWKRALLEKKKQHEQQEELKKKQEQEAYIKSLPAWKRAIVIRDMEKNKAAPITSASQTAGNAPTNPQPAAAQDKWKAGLSQRNKFSSATPEKTESPARSRVAWGGTGGVRAIAVNQKQDSGKPSWAREKSPTSPTNSSPAVSNASLSTGDAPGPRTIIREQRRGSVQSLADQFKEGSRSPPPFTSSQQESKPTEAATSQKSQKKNEVTPQLQVKKEPSPQPTSAPTPAAAPAVQIDDSDLAGLPSWKRALIIKKRQKQAGLIPGANAQPQSELANSKTSTSTGGDKPDSAPKASEPLSSKSPTPNAAKTTKSRPDVVNRANESENSGSNKLVQKEGITLHPPIFNEVDQWANVAKDDPKFTQLPQWKQALILRRRKDIAKRSGQETSPPESPTIKPTSEKRKASSLGSSSQAETKKGSKKVTSKSAGKTEGKKASTTKTKTKSTEEKKTSTKSSTKSKAKSDEEQPAKTVKANATSNKAKAGSSSSTAGRHGSGGIKPVRSAPTKPPEKKEEEKKEEEPMFTWNFSKNSMDTGDAMSNSSDSELEDVQITSIDDELSDEDDSGIGGSGGTILKSYKPLADSSEIEERREKSTTPERSMSTSTSDPVINRMPRSESKSILIEPAKKSHKVLRRVSFSDSNLEIEHFYPKYDYSDYEDIEQERPDIFGRSKLRNSGLSHRLHPSLRMDNDTNSDSYRYGGGFNSSPGGSNTSSPSPPATTETPITNGVLGGGGLSSYTPSMLSPFDNLSSFTASPIASPIKEEEASSSMEVEQVDGNSADDYYSSLNADTAALLW